MRIFKKSNRLLCAFILMLAVVVASVILENPAVTGHKLDATRWIWFIIIRLFYIGFAVHFFMMYMKARALESKEQEENQERS